LVKVAVLGAGAGGYTYSADLTLLGHTVTLFELPAFKKKIEPVLKHGGIEILEDVGEPGPERAGFAKINHVTTDIKKAVTGVDIILNPVPANYHETFAKTAAPYLEDGQVVITLGKGGGSIMWYNALKEMGIKKDVTFGELNTLGYGCTLMGRTLGKEYLNKVRIEGPVASTIGGAFPGKDTHRIVDAFTSLYPKGTRDVRPAFNIIETILVDYNALSHPPPIICNAGRIESGDKTFHMFGKNACTESVCRVIEKIDRERIALGKALGIDSKPFEEELKDLVVGKPINIYNVIHIPYLEICEGPFNLKTRYLTEDIPFGLVTFSSLGEMLGVPTPVCDALITIASVLNDEDYRKTGRTVQKLGIKPYWTVEQLNRFLETGEA
jgi:opine dehydrogenase